MRPMEGAEEEPWWQVWLTRVLVAVAIAAALEYIGRQPLPERTKTEASDNEFSPLQYGELSTEKANGQEELSADNTFKEKTEALAADKEQKNDSERNGGGSGKRNTDGKEKVEEDADYKDDSSSNNDQGNGNAETENGSNDVNNETEEHNTTAAGSSSEPQKVKFKNKSSAHPGMSGFHHWYDIETSLYRQYQVGRTDGVDVYPNYVPHSRRGTVKVNLRVTNEMTTGTQAIDVYWINYKGNEDHKGKIVRGGTWHQTTWIEHPWVFRLSDTNELLLHYIPDRVIQHLEEAPTCDENDPTVGMHVFTFRRPTAQAERDHHICSIIDPILPHPASHHFHNTNQAHDWTLLHMKRQEYFTYHPEAQLLTKYLTNIVMHPAKPSYRKIRIANKNFFQGIWQTAARGLLLAAGFVEQHAYAELGTADPLPSTRVQDISLVLFRLEQVKTQLKQDEAGSTTNNHSSPRHSQPDGADGTGRAGFGRAGEMNARR